MPITLETLLQDTISKGGSDLHLIDGSAPCQRLAGEIVKLAAPLLGSEAILSLVSPFLNEPQQAQFKAELRVNNSFTIQGLGRFRMNLCRAQGTANASIRVIPSKIYPLDALGLPPIVAQLCQKRRGLILITGPTGAGKSTSMAAMIDHINRTGRPGKVITIEEPIETLFVPERCVFVQREVGVDVASYEVGIQDALRQDPDVLAIGEMRTADSMKGAITAAETGHLVLTTLHTPDAAKTAQRILSAMPGEEQDAIRDQLCLALEAILSLELLPRADRRGLALATEVLLATPAVRRLIHEGRLDQIYDVLQTGSSQGMICKDASIKAMLQRGTISRETALAHMRSPELLNA